jgi:polysaccharide export outer membrane protein
LRPSRLASYPKLVLLACLVAVGCGGSLPDYDYSKEPDPRKREYTIGVSDELSITVWKNPELTTATTVRPDGTITMPLIGDLEAAGRTPTSLKKDITERLGQYIKDTDAVVSIAVVAVNSLRFTVSGEVARPGVFNTRNYVTVGEAIALAGGFTRFAEKSSITVVRPDGKGGFRRIPIVWSAIASGRHPEMNIYLLADDTVYVP